MDNFNNKYLKYKLKYFKEKYQVRGGSITDKGITDKDRKELVNKLKLSLLEYETVSAYEADKDNIDQLLDNKYILFLDINPRALPIIDLFNNSDKSQWEIMKLSWIQRIQKEFSFYKTRRFGSTTKKLNILKSLNSHVFIITASSDSDQNIEEILNVLFPGEFYDNTNIRDTFLMHNTIQEYNVIPTEFGSDNPETAKKDTYVIPNFSIGHREHFEQKM